MAETFKTTKIYLFDVHTTLMPVLSKNVPEPLRLLVEADEYRKAYRSGWKISTKNLDIAPLNPVTIQKHLFWQWYAVPRSGAAPDYWAIQMPFVCRPRSVTISFETKEGRKASVGASINLFTLGWSSNLEFDFGNQEVTPESLMHMTAALRVGEKVFRIDGQEKNMTDVFRWLGHRITSECYQGFQKVHDEIRVPSYIVMALTNYSGEAQKYEAASESGMHPAVRAQMHSMLLGKKLEAEELIEAEIAAAATGSLGFLITRLRYLDFGITYFDLGTLLFLQDAFDQKKVQTFFCFASNIKNFLMMVNVWLGFRKALLGVPKGQGSADVGLICPDSQLCDLRQRYPTPFARKYHEAHSILKKCPE
jgi:hypothetical protein